MDSISAKNIEASEIKSSNEGCSREECMKHTLQDEQECLSDEALRYSDLADGSAPALWEARASFLLGLSALEEKDARALKFFDDASPLAEIGDYILFFKAKAYSQKKEFPEAVYSYDLLLETFPGSALKAEAKYLRARSLMDAGDLFRARDGFFDFISSFPRHDLVPDALLGAAYASMALYEQLEAAKAARKILSKYPAHPASKEAEALIARAKKGAEIPPPTPEEKFQRAQNLFDAARYEEAVTEFSYLVKNKKSEYYDPSVIRLATAQSRLKLYDRAERTLKEYLKGGSPQRELDALYRLAIIAVRQNKEEMLLDIEKRLSEKFHNTATHARVLVFLGRYYESKSMGAKALTAYRHVLKDFAGTPSADDALWSIGWMAYRNGKYLEAYNSFSEYPKVHPQGKNAAQFLYWRGRSAERMAKPLLAQAGYEDLCREFRESFYCRMAEERFGPFEDGLPEEAPAGPEVFDFATTACTDTAALDSLASESIPLEIAPAGSCSEESSTQEVSLESAGAEEEDPEDKGRLFQDSHYLAAQELLTLGLGSRAADEIEILARRYSNDESALIELAGLFNRAEDYYRALRIYQRYLSGLKNRYKTAVLLPLAFPPEVVDMIKEQAPESIDPYLVAAVMREESEFNPKAISVTGALGLMQIMPATGKLVAKELGRGEFDSRDLLNPEVNIRLGSTYLGMLLKRFNNDIVLTVAGYNAGPIAVSRWKESLPFEADEFIESIPYPETRNYAKKVLRSYAEFMRAAGIKPKERLTKPSANRPGEPAAGGIKDGRS